MAYIKQLSNDLIKKIAAGEVIERPASVVKELVENSIDAGATIIEVEIKNSCKYIKVADNGMGIDPDDIPLLFSRHATSKIKYFNDLWSLQSLGFRGEALASISSVSRIICRSKHINQDYGFEIKYADEKPEKKTSAISIGTVFEVTDLFYNVPARQKFLKSEQTEVGHICDTVLPEALAHPKISFKLFNNRNLILETSGSKNQDQAIIELLGADLKNKLISLNLSTKDFKLSGFISALEVHRSDRKSIFVFINKRPVKCQIVSKAVSSAFEGLLPSGKFPVVVLNLEFNPSCVDVNVHPTKKEVRYTHPNDVYSNVLHCVQNTIADFYKKHYEEQSVYSMPEIKEQSVEKLNAKPQEAVHALKEASQYKKNDLPNEEYSKAALNLYTPLNKVPIKDENKIEQNKIIKDIEKQKIFSSNDLKCYMIYSEKPIANMTKVGNKTIFEVGNIFEDNAQIVFSGEITGNPEYQKEFFNSLANLSKEIYKTRYSNKSIIQKKIINDDLDSEVVVEKGRKNPPKDILYKVWERDNWTCVYCGKQLLDPEIVKKTITDATNAFLTYTNDERNEVTVHVLREHIASHDHHLPVSKLPQFEFEEGNLFACCISCNKKKLDSMGLKSWSPERKNNWTKDLIVAGLIFDSPKTLLNKFLQNK